jgi:hypothetical protein
MLTSHSYDLCKNWARKISRRPGTVKILLAFLIVTGLIFSSGCTGWAQRREQALKMVGSGSEEVKKRIGEPSVITKKPDNSIVWIYRPPYKLMPNQEGSVYLEFLDGKVVKTFSLK